MVNKIKVKVSANMRSTSLTITFEPGLAKTSDWWQRVSKTWIVILEVSYMTFGTSGVTFLT
jgi:hypothetical protein